MTADYPGIGDIPQLRSLWKKAFGDTDAFLDIFFSTGYSPDRCRFIRQGGIIGTALYWMDLDWDDRKFAYIYAVATDPGCRGRGLCRQLMADTAALLTGRGYAGAILVPQDEGLRAMYAKMGYLPAAPIDQVFCASSAPCPVTQISPSDYAARRASLVPEGSLSLSREALDFLGELARFYAGDGFLAAVSLEPEHLRILEYLGNRELAPCLVAALGATEATLCTPGQGTPLGMYLPLSEDCPRPEYYPFAFD